MRKLLLALAITAAVLPTAARAGDETFASSGVMNGKNYTSVTMTYGPHYTITYHFSDGTHFTAVVESDAFWMLFAALSETRNVGGD